jgi:hypothetical protein
LATPRDSSKQLRAAVARLIGESRKATHGELFRVEVTSSDGQRHAVTVQVDTHPKVPSAAAMNDLADRLRIARDSIDDVLTDWTPDQLAAHLASLTKAELRSREPIARPKG